MHDVFDENLDPRIKVFLDDTGDCILAEQSEIQFRCTKRSPCLVVHAKDQIPAAMIGERGKMPGKFRPRLIVPGVHPGFKFDIEALVCSRQEIRQIKGGHNSLNRKSRSARDAAIGHFSMDRRPNHGPIVMFALP